MANQKVKNFMYRSGVVLTFGTVYWISKARAKRLSKKVNAELTSSQKIDFSVDSIINALGTKTNIKDISSTLSSVSVIVDDMTKVDEKEFRKNGIQGVLKRANKLTLIFGDNAPAIKKVISNMVKVSDTISNVGDQLSDIKDKLVS